MEGNSEKRVTQAEELEFASGEEALDAASDSGPQGRGDRDDHAGRLKAETQASPDPATDFPVVGVGASAGGLEAFRHFFTQMPDDTGMAFVLVQHLDPNHDSMLVQLLQRHTRMPVHQIRDHMRVEPNHVYVIPPNRNVVFRDGKLELSVPAGASGRRHSIDRFFRSLASDQQDRAICIVLSGTGSDGTLGLKAVKAAGGMAMVQDPATSQHDAMPFNALTTDLADYVLPPSEMAQHLLNFAQHALGTEEEPHSAHTDDAVMRIFGLLQEKKQHDFSGYKSNTMRRRIRHRMAIRQVNNLDEFVELLQQKPGEIENLFHDLLISVTSFFRNPEAFGILEREVLPRIVKRLGPEDPIRVWVPGCATGDEAYSIAIVIAEYLEREGLDHDVQIFATDIDPQAIARAREGVYPEGVANDVTPLRLQRYFVHKGHTYRVRRRIRDMVAFAVQSLTKDPPFSRLDLISCRNVLIYFGSALQKGVIPLFHYALKPGGFLFLGSSESLGDHADIFEVLDRKWRFFRRPLRSTTGDVASFVRAQNDLPLRKASRLTFTPRSPSMRELAQRLLLDVYAPPSVIAKADGDILYIYGETGDYLAPAAGEPDLNVLRMAREGLRMPLATALRKAATTQETVLCNSAGLEVNDGEEQIRISVRPLTQPTNLDGLFLVSFENNSAPPSRDCTIIGASVPADGDGDRSAKDIFEAHRIAVLEQQLSTTQEYLQTTVEELETSNEELQATNEELQSANEELQSANEELQTSQEELQSVNEELITVNNELQIKIDALTQANNDINNLLNSIPVGVIFLDHDLNIERFNPPAQDVVNLIESDLGRPLAHFAPNLDGEDLVGDAREVLQSLQEIERDVRSHDGRWYWMRVQPYITMEDEVDGLILTFADITRQKAMQRELQQHRENLEELVEERTAELEETIQELNDSRQRYRVLVETSPDLIARFGTDLQHLYVNAAMEELTGIDRETYVGSTNEELRHSPELVTLWNQELRQVFDTGEPSSMEFSYVAVDGDERHLQALLAPELDRDGEVNSVVSVVRDLTEFEETKRALAASSERYEALFHGAENPIAIFDGDANTLMINDAAASVFGVQTETSAGCPGTTTSKALLAPLKERIRQVLETDQPMRFTDHLQIKGEERWYSTIAQPITHMPGWGAAVQMIAYDMTDIKRAEAALRKQEEQFRMMVEQLPAGAVYREGQRVWINQAVERITGYRQDELETVDAWFTTLYGDDAEKRQRAHETYGARGFPDVATLRIRTKDGDRRWVEFAGVKISDTADLSVMHDVTAQYQAAADLEEALEEKETLLRELYHRTKNNMQVISAIIDVQAQHVEDEAALAALKETQTRIHSIALVHQKLYESKTLSQVDLSSYVSDLTQLLMRSYRLHDSVRIDLDLESVQVIIDTALPCGLVLNELMSNALKHAFPQGRAGKINIELKREDENGILLKVSDDGVGVPESFDFRRAHSLGLQTVYAVGEHQLQGAVTFRSQPDCGVTCEIRFRDDAYLPSV